MIKKNCLTIKTVEFMKQMEKLDLITLCDKVGERINNTSERFVKLMDSVTKSPLTWTWDQEAEKELILGEGRVIMRMLLTLSSQTLKADINEEIRNMVSNVVERSNRFVNITYDALQEEIGE